MLIRDEVTFHLATQWYIIHGLQMNCSSKQYKHVLLPGNNSVHSRILAKPLENRPDTSWAFPSLFISNDLSTFQIPCRIRMNIYAYSNCTTLTPSNLHSTGWISSYKIENLSSRYWSILRRPLGFVSIETSEKKKYRSPILYPVEMNNFRLEKKIFVHRKALPLITWSSRGVRLTRRATCLQARQQIIFQTRYA